MSVCVCVWVCEREREREREIERERERDRDILQVAFLSFSTIESTPTKMCGRAYRACRQKTDKVRLRDKE